AAKRAAELYTREADVAAREAAVDAVVNAIVATPIENGTWTGVGDVEPGTYRTAEAVSSQCYCCIYRRRSNGSDIIDNDIVDGGFPTVTLSAGQDFENSGCGTFIEE